MSFQSSSVFIKVGLCLSIVGLFVTFVSVFTPFWMVNSSTETDLGLFFICQDGHCTTDNTSDAEKWQVALAVMEGLGLLLALSSVVFAVLYVFVSAFSNRKWVQLTVPPLAFGAGLFLLIGVLICANKKDDFPEVYPGYRPTFDFGWSFAFAIIAGLLYLAAGICFALDAFV